MEEILDSRCNFRFIFPCRIIIIIVIINISVGSGGRSRL